MIDAIVIHSDRKQDRVEGLGRHQFKQLPRIGECIELEQEGTGHLYRVVAVHHPMRTDHSRAAVDLFVEHVGETSAVIAGYRQSV